MVDLCLSLSRPALWVLGLSSPSFDFILNVKQLLSDKLGLVKASKWCKWTRSSSSCQAVFRSLRKADADSNKLFKHSIDQIFVQVHVDAEKV